MDKLKRYTGLNNKHFRYCLSDDVAALEAKNAELVAAIKDWLSCEDSPQEWMRCRDKAKRALAKTEMEGQ